MPRKLSVDDAPKEDMQSTDNNSDPNIDSHNPGETASTWQRPKTRKTSEERSISFVGAIVPARLKHDSDDSHKRDQEVLSKGPNGSPVYDRLGYKINYKILKGSSRRRRPSRNAARYLALVEAEIEQIRRLREIMGRSNESAAMLSAWQDRVARDLDIPFHTVDMPEYEEWHRRGFRLEPGELAGNPSKDESERLLTLAVGSAFRE
ncbi:hypothetical protein QBC33DRAFT_256363 [Phialemonium atrogriseum]|uniref:Uncharacterized protein n=1 Tax=Phialemonium atrogriseum TaxID=1093897 RepID=A0AAJ0BQN7_9PEZI|nr:uncharacterized protein QBC33DRAFT_256363 [Phialemonium atrogriseum]KAK1762699.1 hypothetical protein QBC33DRAFT_256363 [Phialemonium atrogriseum]